MTIRALSVSAVAAAAATMALAQAPTATAVEPGPNNIIGGSTATSDPGAVSLSTTAGQFFCSGSLLTPTKVLTAKHCTDATSSFQIRAKSLYSASGGSVHGVANVVSQNDVSVVTLSSPVEGGKTVTLASQDPPVGSTNQIFGWGRTSEFGSASPVLKTANVRVTSLNSTDAFGGRAIYSTGIDGSAWKGDSGGPQFYNGRQVGVASMASAQARIQIYASVQANLAFIKNAAGLN